MVSLKKLNELYDWNLITATPEQKKEIITTVLKGFVLYPNGIEYQFKLPHKELTEEHVAELLSVSMALPENYPPHRFGISRKV
jgi:hypothetical protein